MYYGGLPLATFLERYDKSAYIGLRRCQSLITGRRVGVHHDRLAGLKWVSADDLYWRSRDVYLVQSILQAFLESRTSLEIAVVVLVEQHVARLRAVV